MNLLINKLLLDACVSLPVANSMSSKDQAAPTLLLYGAWAFATALFFGLWMWHRAERRALLRLLAQKSKAATQKAERNRGVQQQSLDTAKNALKAAEIALAAQKKKNYQLKEELLAQQALATDAKDRANAAIEDAQRARSEVEAQSVQQRPMPRRHKEAQSLPQPEPEAIVADPPPTFTAEQMAYAQSAVAQANQARAASMQAQSAQAAEIKELRREMGRKNKRIEDLRRVDLMSRGKIEVLEDKVRRLGRENYESISLLAQLRGEVGTVPGPKNHRVERGAEAAPANGASRVTPVSSQSAVAAEVQPTRH